jgi:hypothetical protein
VRDPDVDDDGDVRLGDGGKPRDLAGHAHTRLEDREANAVVYGPRGRREADEVVQVAPRGHDLAGRLGGGAEERRGERLRRRLASAARDREDARVALASAPPCAEVRARREAPRDQRVVHLDGVGARVVAGATTLRDDEARARVDGLREVVVPVHALPP